MKEILGFHLNGCPYCHNAFRAIEELQAENPAVFTHVFQPFNFPSVQI